MPFVGPSAPDPASWRPVWTVDLRQLPETERGKVHFEVLAEFGFTGRPPTAGPHGAAWPRSDLEYYVPRGFTTDLATVPRFLWGVVASYGRQTLPAILHDTLCIESAMPSLPAAYRRHARRRADALFRGTLAQAGSGPVRRWLMWTGVRIGGHVPVGVALGVAAVLALLAVLLPWTAPLGLGAAVAAVVLLALVVTACVESVRRTGPATGDAPGPPADEWTAPAFDGRALGSLVGALGLSVVAAPILLPVSAVTFLTARIMQIGERRLPPPVPAGPPVTGEGVTARIAWAPLQASPER